MNLSGERLKSVAVVLALGGILSLTLEGLVSSPDAIKAEEISQPQEIETKIAPLVLEAHAAFVVDLRNNSIIFAKNADEKLPLASLTKLMTALVARENIDEKSIITLSSGALKTEGDNGLREGERFRISDLLDIMLVVSSNDVAHVLATSVGATSQQASVGNLTDKDTQFVRMMNEKARTLGFTQTEFFNETGLDINPAQNGGYGSAREVAALFAQIHKKFPSMLEVTTRKHARFLSQEGMVHVFPNTNEAISYLPGLIASKTGYTTLAGGNLAIMFDGGVGHTFVAVVLGSTHKGRFEDMRKLMQAVRGTL